MADYREAFVGIDVAKLKNAIAIAEAGREGEVRFFGEVDASAATMRRVISRFDHVHFCYEAGPTGYGLYRLIRSLGHECTVVAPSLIPRKPGDRVKTNRRDAISLARLLRAGELTAVWVPDEDHEAMRDLVRARAAAVETLRVHRQQVSAFMLKHGRLYPRKTSWTMRYLRWLQEQRFDHPAHQIALQEMVEAVRVSKERVERLERTIEEFIPAWSLAPLVRALQALRGVNLIIAVTFATEVGDGSRFESPRQLMGYLGLVPSERSTGETIRRGGITKAGNGRVRHMLVESAWTYRHPPKIGKMKLYQLEQAPQRVIVVRRPKYACRACEDVVVQASAPMRLIEGGLPTEATVAQVLVSKYADHLPLYRQAQIYAWRGINLDRSTLADWVGRAAWHLRPVHGRLLEKLKASPKLFADETTAPVLDPGRGKTKTGQLWAYARDDRPWQGADPPGVAYVYAPDRKAERPIAHLAGFTGILQVDGYGGYRVLAEKNGVTLAFCWAHVRRRFYELAMAGPAPIASEALKRIAELYKIEDDIRGSTAEARRAVRQERSMPVVAELEPWLREKLGLISQKTKLAEAIRYTLSRWEGLTRFLDDGCVEIDSNVVERSIRPIALNRKNVLFAGSDGGAEHWAVIASLIETCKLNDVEPLGYLADVLTRIVNGHPNSQIDDLLPWAYIAAPELKAVA